MAHDLFPSLRARRAARSGRPGRTILALAAGLALAATAPAAAQQFAIPGRIPAKPLTILSIPDTAALWRGFAASPLGAASQQHFADPAFQNSPQYESLALQIDTIHEQSGINLWPSALFTEELSGLDLYVVDRDGLKEMVVVMKSPRPGFATQVLDAIEKDASSATGVANSFTAETVEKKTISGKRALSLPAFEMHLAADSDQILIWSTDAKALESSLLNEGKNFPASDEFIRKFKGLGDGNGHLWMVGNFANIEPILSPSTAALPPVPMEAVTSGVGALRVAFDPAFIKATTFTSFKDMDELSRRYGIAAPSPGDVSLMNFFSEDSLAVFATNYFDGIVMLEQGLGALSGATNSPVSPQQVEQQLDASRQVFGFDLRNDLLANLGPSLGFSLTSFDLPQDGGGLPVPEVDFVLVAGVKSRDRFEKVLEKLEALMNPQGAAPTTQGGAKPTSPLKTEMVDGMPMKYYEDPQLVAIGFRPSYMLTKDNYLILSLHPDAIKEAMRRYNGEEKAILETDLYESLNRQLSADRNSVLIAPAAPLVRMIRNNKEALTQGLTPEQSGSIESTLQILEAIKGLSVTSTYQSEGKKQEVLIGM